MTCGDADPLHAHRLLIDACLNQLVPFFWHGPGTLLISGSGIRAVLDQIHSAGEVVIGLEGFELESTIVHPRLDLIFDASTSSRGSPGVVVAEWGQNVWIDVTLALGKGPSEVGPQ